MRHRNTVGLIPSGLAGNKWLRSSRSSSWMQMTRLRAAKTARPVNRLISFTVAFISLEVSVLDKHQEASAAMVLSTGHGYVESWVLSHANLEGLSCPDLHSSWIQLMHEPFCSRLGWEAQQAGDVWWLEVQENWCYVPSMLRSGVGNQIGICYISTCAGVFSLNLAMHVSYTYSQYILKFLLNIY